MPTLKVPWTIFLFRCFLAKRAQPSKKVGITGFPSRRIPADVRFYLSMYLADIRRQKNGVILWLPYALISALVVLLLILSLSFRMGTPLCCMPLLVAYSARWIELALMLVIREKVFRCKRFPLRTPGASFARGIVLGYSVIHNEGHSLLSRLGMCQHRSGRTLLPLHFTTKPPVVQLHRIVLSVLLIIGVVSWQFSQLQGKENRTVRDMLEKV